MTELFLGAAIIGQVNTNIGQKLVLKHLAQNESQFSASPRCTELVACSEVHMFACRKVAACNTDMEAHELYRKYKSWHWECNHITTCCVRRKKEVSK